jgi:hypothetical protein
MDRHILNNISFWTTTSYKKEWGSIMVNKKQCIMVPSCILHNSIKLLTFSSKLYIIMSWFLYDPILKFAKLNWRIIYPAVFVTRRRHRCALGHDMAEGRGAWVRARRHYGCKRGDLRLPALRPHGPQFLMRAACERPPAAQRGTPAALAAQLWQPTQENTVLSPKPIHFGH